jgi:transcriptional regulator with XRE-family HTH domain
MRNRFRAAALPSYGNDMPGSRPLLRTTLGDVLRRIRLDQGRTLADVAAAGRISMQYLSELERGLKEASSEILAAICDALEVDLPDVLAEVGRDLAGAGPVLADTVLADTVLADTGFTRTDQQAVVLPLGTGPEHRAVGVRPGDVVGLAA